MSGVYFNPLKRVFLNLSGGTVTGNTVFTQGVAIESLSATTFYSGSTNLDTVVSNIAINLFTGGTFSGSYLSSSGGTGGEYYFTGNTTGQTIYIEDNIFPQNDDNSDLGTSIKRFRSLHTVNGIAVNFTAETKITTPILELGNVSLDENNVILTGNTISGGNW